MTNFDLERVLWWRRLVPEPLIFQAACLSNRSFWLMRWRSFEGRQRYGFRFPIGEPACRSSARLVLLAPNTVEII